MWALQHSRTAHVLSRSSEFTASLPASAQASASSAAPAYITDLLAVKRGLTIRGNRPTSITILRSGDWLTEARALGTIPLLLAETAASITELRLLPAADFSAPENQEYSDSMITQYLQNAASAFTNLHTLTLDSHTCALPSPWNVPRLKHLTVNSDMVDAAPAYHAEMSDELSSSISQLLPQLTALTAKGWDIDYTALLPPQACTQLAELHVSTWLDPELLTLWLQRMPNIRALSVGMVEQAGLQPMGMQWALERLHIKCCDTPTGLYWLPVSSAGRIMVTVDGTFHIKAYKRHVSMVGHTHTHTYTHMQPTSAMSMS